jgi:hypothetical protein
MAAALLVVSVDWYGPFVSLLEARQRGDETGLGEFLYLAFRTDGDEASYVGLSANSATRLTTAHHVLGSWPENSGELWIGVISSQVEAGRKPVGSPKSHSGELHFAEHMTAYFVETKANIKKRSSPPSRSGVVLNRWFRGKTPWERWFTRPHAEWPDLIEYEISEEFARLVWFGGKVLKYDSGGIEGCRRVNLDL